MVPVLGALGSFLVGLIVGGFAIYVAARVVVDVDSYANAVVTAFFGALAWALLGWIPLFGALFALVAWVGVLNWRYPGGWLTAAIIGLVAWLSAMLVRVLLGALGVGWLGATGVPGI